MLPTIKQALKKTFLFNIVVWFRRRSDDLNEIRNQSQSNAYYYSPIHDLIKDIAAQHSIKVFFETGTYLGNTVYGVKDSFDEVYSVELSKGLAELARERFRHDPKVHIINDDSSAAVETFLGSLVQPAIFWLDAHYSAGVTAKGKLQTPVKDELESILSHSVKQHQILIDDVKDFNGQNDYPTVEEIFEMVRQFGAENYKAKVEGEVFRISPV